MWFIERPSVSIHVADSLTGTSKWELLLRWVLFRRFDRTVREMHKANMAALSVRMKNIGLIEKVPVSELRDSLCLAVLVIISCFTILYSHIVPEARTHVSILSTFVQLRRPNSMFFIHIFIIVFLTLHRWEGLVSKHFTVKSTTVVFITCDKYNLIWFD